MNSLWNRAYYENALTYLSILTALAQVAHWFHYSSNSLTLSTNLTRYFSIRKTSEDDDDYYDASLYY